MYNSLFINFYFRKSTTDATLGSVNVRVTVNGKRITLGTVTSVADSSLPKSVMIQYDHWDKRKLKVKPQSPHATLLNKAIAESEQKLQKVYAQHESFDQKMTANGLKGVVKHGQRMLLTFPSLIDKFLEEKVALKTKASTVDTYRFKIRPLLAFLESENALDLPAVDFTPGTLKRYRTYLITQRGNSDRNADKSCQVVKTLLLWAAENELIHKNPLMNIRIRVDKTPNLECVTQEELAVLRDAVLLPQMREVADCFEFACYTGLAYQDMKALSPKNLQLVEGKHCIVGYRLKTGTEYCIPVTERVWALMEKYDGINLPLPALDDYNPLLRQIMFSVGIDKRITSHTARKTFADWCINEVGLSEEATIVAMGQKNAKELTPYRKTRPKRLLAEFPTDLMRRQIDRVPFKQIVKAS
ncbi:phage integrase SAM-like domain-containing protein [Spirosoma oryzicola]|uniref:phage integrase SAM-like domain-containing protein n=1 Tax=Spirosoma oryzicola TaxID=2898794 RepID=UPI001E34DDE8|nr:phage integrase SAM-like domain-containing protein [Spirosoma oryzicola]UHG93195.1 site-specific integrase [Spirosoma oryzicola]